MGAAWPVGGGSQVFGKAARATPRCKQGCWGGCGRCGLSWGRTQPPFSTVPSREILHVPNLSNPTVVGGTCGRVRNPATPGSEAEEYAWHSCPRGSLVLSPLLSGALCERTRKRSAMADSDAAESSVPAEASGQVILVLRNLLAERYPDLGRHVNTVARLCEQVAPEVGLLDQESEALAQAAFVHDIGKLSLPESILVKPDSLNEDEWRLMRQHPLVGAQILLAAGLRGRVIDFVHSSHERIDGTGYPDGLAGEEIPLGARIIAVVRRLRRDDFASPAQTDADDQRGRVAGADARIGHPVRHRRGRCRVSAAPRPEPARSRANAGGSGRGCEGLGGLGGTCVSQPEFAGLKAAWEDNRHLVGTKATETATKSRDRSGSRRSTADAWSTPTARRLRGPLAVERSA